MARLMKISKALMTSRLAVGLCLLHLVLFFYTIFEKPTEPSLSEQFPGWHFAGVSYFAGRNFHFSYESLLYQIVTILDLPAMCLAVIPSLPVFFLSKALGLSLSAHTESWLVALIILLAASVQWLIVGYLIEGFIRPNRNSRSQENES